MSIHAQIEHLPADRREPVMAWLTASIGDCATCASPVTRIQPRRTGKAGLEHLDCQGAAGGDPEEGGTGAVSAAVEARARRSDWG